MNDLDLEKYCAQAVERGASHAIQIHPNSIVTAAWVRLKCQFGCRNYNSSYCCPPYTPTPEETRRVIDGYDRAILFHLEAPATPDRGKRSQGLLEMLTDFEGEIFKEGYYKAFLFLGGPCHFYGLLKQRDEPTWQRDGLVSCKECAKVKGDPCRFGLRARPSMEGCGIDVFQTARNNGFFIQPLREKTETQNLFRLMLVD